MRIEKPNGRLPIFFVLFTLRTMCSSSWGVMYLNFNGLSISEIFMCLELKKKNDDDDWFISYWHEFLDLDGILSDNLPCFTSIRFMTLETSLKMCKCFK
ncbi:hypothetical protein LguiA_030584 [Lonicera macranthoides]